MHGSQFEDQPTFGEISMHERQEAILHMLASHEDTRSNDSDSDTASVLSASSAVDTAQRARSFFGGIEQYAAKKNQQVYR